MTKKELIKQERQSGIAEERVRWEDRCEPCLDAAMAGESAALERVAELEGRIEQVRELRGHVGERARKVVDLALAILAPGEEE